MPDGFAPSSLAPAFSPADGARMLRGPIPAVLLCLSLVGGCGDPRRAEIERRNADYERRQTAAQDMTPLLTPEPEPLKVDQLLACTPEKPGWPVDREACDRATERVREAAEEDRQDLAAGPG